MHFTQIKLKPTTKIETNFDTKDIGKGFEAHKDVDVLFKKYRKSKEHSDFYNYDLLMTYDNSLIYGFDYAFENDKLFIPEINPTTIFYSNAVMSHRNLVFFRKELKEKSPSLKHQQKPLNPNLFGHFFQLASNCIINLQATVESFANRQIREDHKFIDKSGKKFEPSLFHKIDKALPEIKGIRFKSKFKQDNYRIRKLIELRNEIIHLEPIRQVTNTKYKITYRRLISFDYTQTILSVEKFVNFYEPNLIEKCECKNELYYDISEILAK
ncbi:hypothetical protein [Zobellia roscoffensis]|uniref:hypothetical protein n=1 Tax=Zobellia roscoffensis TaxID=2779508 RepID=UPI00188CE06F|nr:hypothetical protein [Zobellia roscoffensis]